MEAISQLSASSAVSSPSNTSTTTTTKSETMTTNTMISMEEPFGELDGDLNGLPINAKISLSLKTMSVKQLYLNQWQRLQSWGSFIDTNRMKTPNSSLQWSRRLVRNVEHFQSNYLCVFLILVIYCVLTSPLLLLAIAAVLGASYILSLKNSESPLKIFGYQFSLAQQYLFLMVASFPLFYFAGAGSAVFWVIGASFFVIGLHASIYAIEMQDSIEEHFQFPNNLQVV